MSEPVIHSSASGNGTGSYALSGDHAVEAPPPGGKPGTASGKPLPPEPAPAELPVLVEQLNRAIRSIGRELRFEVDLDSGEAVIQVLDRETGEIIRRIPSEEVRTYFDGERLPTLRLYDALI